MLQEFNTNTLSSKFIKNLLYKTPVPIYPVIKDTDRLISGMLYVYNNYIIRALKSGLFIDTEISSGLVFPGDTVYPSEDLFPSYNVEVGQYQVLAYYTPPKTRTNDSHVYRSNTSYYDSETHRNLGRYIYYLNQYNNVDLRPYYNCFCNKFLDSGLISNGTFEPLSRNNSYKLTTIPVRFGATYTIAVTSDSVECILRFMTPEGSLVSLDGTDPLFKSTLDQSYVKHTETSFYKPFTFTVSRERIGTDDLNSATLFHNERYLTLIMQLPTSCNSSIVVLEGDYTDKQEKVVCKKTPLENYNATDDTPDSVCGVEIPTYYVNPRLLFINSGKQFAFTDKLIQYLLGNVIHSGETLSGNIAYIQDLICDSTTKNTYIQRICSQYSESLVNRNSIRGVWDSTESVVDTDILSKTLILLQNEIVKDNFLLDRDGYIDTDFERLLFKVLTK